MDLDREKTLSCYNATASYIPCSVEGTLRTGDTPVIVVLTIQLELSSGYPVLFGTLEDTLGKVCLSQKHLLVSHPL